MIKWWMFILEKKLLYKNGLQFSFEWMKKIPWNLKKIEDWYEAKDIDKFFLSLNEIKKNKHFFHRYHHHHIKLYCTHFVGKSNVSYVYCLLIWLLSYVNILIFLVWLKWNSNDEMVNVDIDIVVGEWNWKIIYWIHSKNQIELSSSIITRTEVLINFDLVGEGFI